MHRQDAHPAPHADVVRERRNDVLAVPARPTSGARTSHAEGSRLAERTISAIAYAAGFGDLSHFNSGFRRRYGAKRRPMCASSHDARIGRSAGGPTRGAGPRQTERTKSHERANEMTDRWRFPLRFSPPETRWHFNFKALPRRIAREVRLWLKAAELGDAIGRCNLGTPDVPPRSHNGSP
jgi:AraC-like DNA-binding protein